MYVLGHGDLLLMLPWTSDVPSCAPMTLWLDERDDSIVNANPLVFPRFFSIVPKRYFITQDFFK